MAFFGSNFVNPPVVDGRVEGPGKYVFKDGNYYIGNFVDGRFHGSGTLHFTNGMRYEGIWSEGVATEGTFFFKDGLKLNPELEHWDYCTPADRRFSSERVNGLRPANESQISDACLHEHIPKGAFDVTEGYFDANDGWVYTYQREKLRRPGTLKAISLRLY